MLFVKYFLTATGIGLLLGAAAILVFDLYRILRWQRATGSLLPPGPDDGTDFPMEEDRGTTPPAIRFRSAGQLAAIGVIPILMGLSFVVVPDGPCGRPHQPGVRHPAGRR